MIELYNKLKLLGGTHCETIRNELEAEMLYIYGKEIHYSSFINKNMAIRMCYSNSVKLLDTNPLYIPYIGAALNKEGHWILHAFILYGDTLIDSCLDGVKYFGRQMLPIEVRNIRKGIYIFSSNSRCE